MPKSFDKNTALRLLNELSRKDPQRKVFGANVHDYELRPPLPSADIELVEKRFSVRLPDDYKTFLTTIGNGGAGPYYGVFPFGQQDDCHDFRGWEGGGLVGDLSQPFRHVTTWNLPESFWQSQPDPPPGITLEDEDKMMVAWDRELEQDYWNPSIMNGAIPICHLGCALRQWLVINGQQKGFVWNDFRADYRGISPVIRETGRQITFSDWYMAWLIESIRTCESEGP